MRIGLLLCLLTLSSTMLAQRGVAPNGYYPASYRGDTFTGTVVAHDPVSDTVSLEYEKGSQSEVLPVKLEGGCAVPSRTGEPMHAKDIPNGTVLTAFYTSQTETNKGGKKRSNVAIAIGFLVWNGKPVSEENRNKFYSCGNFAGWKYFKAFAGSQGSASLSGMEIVVPASK